MKSFVMPYFLGRICWFLAHFSLPLCYIPAILCGFIVLHMYTVSFWGKGSLLGLVALEPFSTTMMSSIIVDGAHESWTRNAISLNHFGHKYISKKITFSSAKLSSFQFQVYNWDLKERSTFRWGSMDRKKKSKLFWKIKKKTDGILEWVVRKLLISHSQFLKCWGRTTETPVNVLCLKLAANFSIRKLQQWSLLGRNK